MHQRFRSAILPNLPLFCDSKLCECFPQSSYKQTAKKIKGLTVKLRKPEKLKDSDPEDKKIQAYQSLGEILEDESENGFGEAKETAVNTIR